MTTRRAGNPSTWMGFGTWERYGQGRVQVGFDEADGSFNALDKIGGAKSHTLSIDEMPPHRHRLPNNPQQTAALEPNFVGRDGGEGTSNYSNANISETTGGGLSHNNMQPYITVFMWRRTA